MNSGLLHSVQHIEHQFVISETDYVIPWRLMEDRGKNKRKKRDNGKDVGLDMVANFSPQVIAHSSKRIEGCIISFYGSPIALLLICGFIDNNGRIDTSIDVTRYICTYCCVHGTRKIRVFGRFTQKTTPYKF